MSYWRFDQEVSAVSNAYFDPDLSGPGIIVDYSDYRICDITHDGLAEN